MGGGGNSWKRWNSRKESLTRNSDALSGEYGGEILMITTELFYSPLVSLDQKSRVLFPASWGPACWFVDVDWISSLSVGVQT